MQKSVTLTKRFYITKNNYQTFQSKQEADLKNYPRRRTRKNSLHLRNGNKQIFIFKKKKKDKTMIKRQIMLMWEHLTA